MRIRQVVRASFVSLLLATTVVTPASADDECQGKKKRGCEVPEVPYTAILPAAGMAGVAGFYLLQRRRSSRAVAVTEAGSDE